MLEQRAILDLCSNTSIQLHDATQTLEALVEEARVHLTNCSNNITQLQEKHSNITQISQELNLTLKSCSNSTAALQKELQSEKSTHLQLKTTCTNNTKTLSASVIKFIERCQEKGE
jgi:chromosome segregation ATPase